MNSLPSPSKGRGAASNPGNRFEKLHLERDPDGCPEDGRAPATLFLRDLTQSVLTRNDSPDVGFETSVNPYRGCEHGCIYCFARPTHEYLGFSAGLDFETRILVKENAPQLLRKSLESSRWKPKVIAMSGVTDCYQPIEKKLRLTRGCLEVLAEFRNPVCMITKNHLITRDVDILRDMAQWNGASINISVTTLDASLTPKLEPRASLPKHRLAAIECLANAGVSVGVLVAPVIPALTDHEMPAILQAARDAGARFAGYVPLRLPFGLAALFEEWLSVHFPERKEKVLGRIRAMRGGKLNDSNFGSRMHGEGIFADQMEQIFEVSVRKAGIPQERSALSTEHFRRVGGSQLELL